MPPPSPPKSPRGLAARLQAKVGPLPVWGWAALILGAYLLYTRLHSTGAAATPATVSGSPPALDTGGSVSGGSGGGTAPSNLTGDQIAQLYGVNAQTIDGLTQAILASRSPVQTWTGSGDGLGYPVGDIGPFPAATVAASGIAPGAVAQAAPAAPSPVAVAAAPPAAGKTGRTQTAAGRLNWGGLSFTTKAAFDAWARAHGTTTGRELKSYPQARAIYGTLH